jgi:hypothetical protein
VFIPLPGSLTLDDWANGVTAALTNYTGVPTLQGEDWQSWGTWFSNNPTLAVLNQPNPYHYSDWRVWGERLADALQQASGSPTNDGIAPAPASIRTGGGDFILTQSGFYLVAQDGRFITTQRKNV